MSDALPQWCREVQLFYLILLQLPIVIYGWLPDQNSKISNEAGQIAHKFLGNATYPDHFTILHQDSDYFLLGGRNLVYNLSVHDLSESKEWRMTWPSTEAHSQLCLLKGKGDDDCQNYIRILVSLSDERLLMCGTNSYKPLCRRYVLIVSIPFVVALIFNNLNCLNVQNALVYTSSVLDLFWLVFFQV